MYKFFLMFYTKKKTSPKLAVFGGVDYFSSEVLMFNEQFDFMSAGRALHYHKERFFVFVFLILTRKTYSTAAWGAWKSFFFFLF